MKLIFGKIGGPSLPCPTSPSPSEIRLIHNRHQFKNDILFVPPSLTGFTSSHIALFIMPLNRGIEWSAAGY